jgi:hypothetical protein
LSILKTFSDSKRLNIMKALSALAKFSGCYERYRGLIKAFGLKWSVNNDDVIIARLIKYSSNGTPNDLYQWIETVNREIPDFALFMDFIIVTGLRFDEAINSYNLIAQLGKQGKLCEYYSEERQVLEHFKFKVLFIRKTKKAFMSFVSSELVGLIASSELPLTQNIIKLRLKRRNIPLHFSDIREMWSSCSVKNLRQPEIDFLQGRVSASVFMQNYFNPTWITDLKKRALKNTRGLLQLIQQ